MATVLYRLGRFAHRRRWLMTGIWLAILVLAGVGSATLSGPTSTSFTLPGTESQQALDLIQARMPTANADAASGRVVFVAPAEATITSSADRRAVQAALAKVKALPRVASVSDPFTGGTVSANGTTAYATVTYTIKATDITSTDSARLQSAGRSAESAGLTVEFGGDAVQAQGGGDATEGVGFLVAAIVLVVTFGSLLAAGLPLLNALAAVGLGMLGISIASGFADVSSTTSALASMLGIAVGVDYALFIVSRFRHELLVGRTPEEAAGRAVGTAGSAVVFAGATVVIALAALTVVGIPFLGTMGLAAAGTVLIAVLLSISLLPALLGFIGERVLGRAGRAALDPEGEPDDPDAADATGGGAKTGAIGLTAHPLGARWARFVVRRRVPIAAIVVVGLLVVAIPSLDLRLGMPSDATASPDTTQRRAYDDLAAAFGAGFNGPLEIAADLSGVRNGRAGASAAAAATKRIQAELGGISDVAAVSPAYTDPAGDLALYTVIPKSGPSAAATGTLVHDIRARARGWRTATGVSVYVTGETAIGIDISQKLSDALIPYLAVVVGLAVLLLMLVFRSLIVPLKATAGFLLSVVATLGAVVAVFQKGWLAGLFGVSTPGPILSFLPILLIGVLFGLAMDYEVFLVTRMREEYVHGAPPQVSVVHGYRHGARVVTAAAIIMTGVFAGFLLAPDPITKSLGFALAAGVLFDAFFVRLTLVPAVMSLLGRWAWAIPGWLDRVMPNVDVEGEQLTRRLEPAVGSAVGSAAGSAAGSVPAGGTAGDDASVPDPRRADDAEAAAAAEVGTSRSPSGPPS